MNTPEVLTLSQLAAQSEQRFCDEAPRLTMEAMFFPLGFPLLVRTNSAEVLNQCEIKWGMFQRRSHEQPIEADIHVVESDSEECPPEVECYFMGNLLVMVADSHNVCSAEFPWGKSRMVVSSAALRHPLYFRFNFLEAASATQLTTRFVTSIHAACVVRGGRGVLLCGDSGAGKTSLSYACARAGWQFVADDTSYIIHGENTRHVIGNFHHVRFRPSAAELFPEIAGAEITPHMWGKPSIELPTAPMANVQTAESADIDFIVYLNRSHPRPASLVPFSKEMARRYMRQVLWGTRETKATRYAAIERLLTAEVFEMRYRSLDWAVERLDQLVREGC